MLAITDIQMALGDQKIDIVVSSLVGESDLIMQEIRRAAQLIGRDHAGRGDPMQVDLVADRIRSNPQTFHGKPTVRDTRVAVEHVLGMLADGASTSDILENYPFLDEDDVRACIAYT